MFYKVAWFLHIVLDNILLVNKQNLIYKPNPYYVFDTTLSDKMYQWLATGRWFSPDTPVSSTNTTDRHDIAETLLTVVLNTITQT
jgi:hypothetical protein